MLEIKIYNVAILCTMLDQLLPGNQYCQKQAHNDREYHSLFREALHAYKLRK